MAGELVGHRVGFGVLVGERGGEEFNIIISDVGIGTS